MRKMFVVAGLILLAALCGFWFFGRPAYHRHKELRAVTRAKDSLARGDLRDAGLSARQALALNPQNLEACRIMAQLAEMTRSPQVLDFHRRVVELAPTIENKLALAAAGLRVQDAPCSVAADTLADLASSADGVVAYHLLAAELALKLNRVPDAEIHFEKVSRLEPTNQVHRLDLAVVRLRGTNETAAAQARATLESLRANTNLAALALRCLAADSVARKDWSGARGYSTALLPCPRSTLEDRLQHLEILRQIAPEDFNNFLATTRHLASTNAPAIYVVATWMAHHELCGAALDWLTNLPPRLQTEQPVALAKVECHFTARDWKGAQRFLESEKWDETDFLRLAFMSRAAEGQGDRLTADGQWRLALRQTSERLGPMVLLLNVAKSWRRPEAEAELLERIARGYPRERWASRHLRELYATTGNTRALHKICAAMADYYPDDAAVKNDFAATALLLKVNLPKAHEVAKTLYTRHPQEPIISTTYAYSLHLQGRSREGLAIMDQLKPVDRENPSLAAYYGLLLEATGSTNRAGRYLALSKRARLLPEETEFVTQALVGLSAR